MSIAVTPVFAIVNSELMENPEWPRRSSVKPGDVAGLLGNLAPSGDSEGPVWSLVVEIGESGSARKVSLPLEQFLNASAYRRTLQEPASLSSLECRLAETAGALAFDRERLWLFRDIFYATDRRPRDSEIDEVALRIKVRHYQRDVAMLRLREQVANFEAIANFATDPSRRAPLADDVTLVVWSRDSGRCVKCGATTSLQFDHVIPWSRGGSDTAENIQLLCRTCNISKAGRLV